MNATLIEKQNLKPIAIFSVFQKGLSEQENETAHNFAINKLKAQNIPFKEVQGVYTYENGKTESEKSILVEVDALLQEQIVEALCKMYNQECYLYATPKRDAILKTGVVTVTQELGKLQEVSKSEAEKLQAYTYCPVLGRYYAAL